MQSARRRQRLSWCKSAAVNDGDSCAIYFVLFIYFSDVNVSFSSFSFPLAIFLIGLLSAFSFLFFSISIQLRLHKLALLCIDTTTPGRSGTQDAYSALRRALPRVAVVVALVAVVAEPVARTAFGACTACSAS